METNYPALSRPIQLRTYSTCYFPYRAHMRLMEAIEKVSLFSVSSLLMKESVSKDDITNEYIVQFGFT